ncbi:hypothetical protein [Pseudomonas citronellolis]|uniref:hypothetical protein n=1 Tax=Pseudomonas citronellolis TaxID=53408 RepID=UPI002FD88D5A
MPEIRCDCGRSQHIGTDDWLKSMTLDQVRYAKEKAEGIIKKADEAPRRTVWCVSDGTVIDRFYREDEYEKAADRLAQIFREVFVREAADFTRAPYGRGRFAEEIPHIYPQRVTQYEYDNEWFPEKKA